MDKINQFFDDHLYQISKGVTHDQLDRNIRHHEFNSVKEWNSRFGYKFHIYNDHLINNQRHFHFYNKDNTIHCKIDFSGNILDSLGVNEIPPNIKKELDYFLIQSNTISILNDYWNKMNT